MKKALIITYYWPPAGGPGVQRWLKFVKYLRQFGVEPVVYIPENPSYPILDDSLTEDVPEDLTILRLPIKEPYRLARMVSQQDSDTISKGIIPTEKKLSFIQKILLFIRGNFFIPDARKAWVKPSVRFLSSYIIENNIGTVITTGPPHSLHLIGLRLKTMIGLKWIADFRDPWTSIGYHKHLKLTAPAAAAHKRLEKKVLQTADQIIVTSFSTQKEFKEITDKPVSIITNGYDSEKIGEVPLDEKFSISHIGSLLTNRNPESLWKVLKELSYEDNTFKSLLKINLIGHVGKEVIESLESFGLTQFVSLKGYLRHDDAIKEQRKSQILLLLEIDSEDTKAIIPGKLFEYLSAGRPILALGPEGWDACRIISDTRSGTCIHQDDFGLLKETIYNYFKAFRKNELSVETENIRRYSRRTLTGQLAQLILN